MPGSGRQVKCEPLSDEEDSNSYVHPYEYLSVEDNVLEELVPLAPAGPAATPVCVKQEGAHSPPHTLETLEPAPQSTQSATLDNRHLGQHDVPESAHFTSLLAVKDEPLSEVDQQQLSGEDTSDSCGRHSSPRHSPKSWTQRDMERALDALRKHHMSLTKASATYGIPSTTLWQRAHRLGIDTPKKEGVAKSWSDADLRAALHALRTGVISANKASKAYGIPSSTLYKIARREGIRLAAPFNAAPTAWRRADLVRALTDIRAGDTVQRAAAAHGIPTGTLYGRCKREGIELSRSNPTPWSEDAMGEALEAVRMGQMSINQAAIHFNLPYSSLYGRFKRCKHQMQETSHNQQPVSQDLRNNEAELVTPDVQYYQHYAQDPHAHTHSTEYMHDSHIDLYGYYQNFSSIVTR